jgi:hypothetical protein
VYKRLPDTQIEKNSKELACVNTELKGNLKAHSFIQPVNPFARQRTGEQITIAQPEHVEIHDILISHFEAAKQIKARNGWLADSFIARMKQEYPEGVPSSRVDDIAHDEAGSDKTALSL